MPVIAAGAPIAARISFGGCRSDSASSGPVLMRSAAIPTRIGWIRSPMSPTLGMKLLRSPTETRLIAVKA